MLYVKNTNLEAVAAIDDYISLIWTERYSECGDFELSVKITPTALDIFKKDYYLFKDGTDVVMIIETLVISYTVDEGYVLTVSGRSLESILDRRVIKNTASLSGKVQEAVIHLVQSQFLYDPQNPNDPRAIEKFGVSGTMPSQDPPDMTDWRNWTISDCQFTGDNLYDVVSTICYEYGLGFKVRLVDGNYIFSMFNGIDHSGTTIKNELRGRENASNTTTLYNDSLHPQGSVDEGIMSFMLIKDPSKVNIGGYGITNADCIKVYEHNMYYYDGKARDVFKFSFVCPDDAAGFTLRVGKSEANFYCDVNGGHDGPYDPYNSNALNFVKGRVYEVSGEVKSRQYWPQESSGGSSSSFDNPGWYAEIKTITSRVYSPNSYPITFSEDYDNLISSSYIESNSALKNVAYVAGEGEGINRTILEVHPTDSSDTTTGLYRRETFVDARDLQSVYYDEDGQQVTLTSSEYQQLLQSRGQEKLEEIAQTTSFEAEVDVAALWKIKIDYDIGDIVNIGTAYGVQKLARITEIVYSEEAGNHSVYPNFELI